MNPDIKRYLFDISESIKLLESHLENIPGLSAYKNDSKTKDAVERRLAIIGEALWKANKLFQIQVSNKEKIIGLRHILIHDYDVVDDDIIWTVCKKHIPVLKKEKQDFLI